MKSPLAICVGLLAFLFGASGASADGSIKDGPAPVAEARTCGTGTFSGMYIGGAIGYAAHDAKFSDEIDGGSFSGDDDGVSASIYSGYNIQCGRFLIGYESDFNYVGFDSSWSDCCQELSSELDWYSTFRLRAGLVHNSDMLFFVTGGLAYAEVDHKFDFPSGNFSDTSSDWQFGWTAGGGVEVNRHSNWSWRAEAFYVDLGDETEKYELSGCGFACEARIGYEDEFWVARIGLTHRFASREEPAPLK